MTGHRSEAHLANNLTDAHPGIPLDRRSILAGISVIGAWPGAAWGATMPDSILAPHVLLAYLVIASTLVGYAVSTAVNADVSSTVANSFAYAAPVVAPILSAALLGEPLSPVKVLAAGVTLSGVALMLRRPVVLS